MINYTLITKPGIILGNLITLAAGFWLASKGSLNYGLFIETLLGLGFIIASACVINNVIDKKLDAKMERTKTRPLATRAACRPRSRPWPPKPPPDGSIQANSPDGLQAHPPFVSGALSAKKQRNRLRAVFLWAFTTENVAARAYHSSAGGLF